MPLSISRRVILQSGTALLAAFGLGTTRAAQAGNVLRIGYQKYGTLILLKGKGTLEKALEPLGFTVEWTEFPAGPQLLEGLNVGAIDFGSTGEAPPIFAQAAGAPLVYVAHEPPAPKGEAILVKPDSPITSLDQLKGKKIALNKGSNVHYLLVKALEKAGVAYQDITPVFLPPADARAAFEQGSVDAWAIWDPFQAAAEAATGARTLTNGEGLVANHQFYLGAKPFVDANPQVIDAVVAQIAELGAWANGNTDQVAEQLSASVKIPAPILKVALERQAFGVKPLSDEVVAQQQKIADSFLALGLIPKSISVADAVRKVSA
ncbi:sulfonate ABC transporter substrate-binding protein [Aestuariivirga sp.]|uniref:sulfonate ABC transporter substrate-binding protein n=1 Tax=Aestuariivirga sp. TaxID=2650926 RepID=UPI003BAA5789